MCLRFAELETKLGEIDRARAVYAHCSEVCDPRVSLFLLFLFSLYKMLFVGASTILGKMERI